MVNLELLIPSPAWSIFPRNLAEDFKTHYNYSDFMKRKSEGMNITFNGVVNRLVFDFEEDIQRKVRLIKCFKKSLDQEYQSIQDCEGFAQFNNTWIATKCYYLLFHLWCLFLSIRLNQSSWLRGPHSGVLRCIKKEIHEGRITFNIPEFNNLHSFSFIENNKGTPGGNLRENYDSQDMEKFLLRKILNYKMEDFKRNNNIDNFRSKNNKQKWDDYKGREFISLLDFFYMYRIKTDYKDVDYLEKSNSDALHKRYHENYYQLTCNLYNALIKMINDVSIKRSKVGLIDA